MIQLHAPFSWEENKRRQNRRGTTPPLRGNGGDCSFNEIEDQEGLVARREDTPCQPIPHLLKSPRPLWKKKRDMIRQSLELSHRESLMDVGQHNGTTDLLGG
jgi:hypothetical protein